MKQAKRKPRSYKTTDDIYKKSMQRAKKEKTSLAAKIEVWLSWYAHGNNINIESD